MVNPDDAPEGESHRSISIARARALVTGIEERASRAGTAGTLRQVEELLTTAAGLRLTLEAERLRRRADALLSGGPDETALGALEDVRERQELLAADLARLSALIDELGAARTRLSGAAAERRPT